MRFEDLQSLLQPVVRGDLTVLYAEFQTRTGSIDSDRFLAWLHERDVVSTERLVQLLKWTDLTVTGLSSLAGRIELDPSKLHGARSGLPPLKALSTAEQHYVQLGRLGGGAMGDVFIAKDRDLFRKVAFKQMTDEVARSGLLAGRFLREVQITAQLDHPNIVPVYSLELTEDGNLGFAMKLVQGKTLEDLLAECRELLDHHQPLPETHTLRTRLEALVSVCDAMAYAHSRGVVHRDLKPENIMIGAYHEVYVVDWGVARLMRSANVPLEIAEYQTDPDIDRTRTGDALGTPSYMSPEQAEGDNDLLDGRSDLYSLGLVLYELISLNRAITGKTNYAMLGRAADADMDPLRHYARQRIHPDLRAIVGRATQRVPAQRYRDMTAMSDDLRRYLRGEPVSARPEGALRRLARWARDHGVAVLVLLVLGVFGTLTVLSLVAVERVIAHDRMTRAAADREHRLDFLGNQVGWHRQRLENELLHYESLLDGLAGAAGHALISDAPRRRQPVWQSADYEDPGTAPPDLRPSPRYNKAISLQTVVFKLAPDVATSAVYDDLQRLAPLAAVMKNTALRSAGQEGGVPDPEAAWSLLGERGVPLEWVYVALETGVHTSWPGHGGYPADYDPRGRPWYGQARDRVGVVWGEPYVDVNTNELVIAATTALRSEQGVLLGVAGFDITLDQLRDHYFVSVPGIEAPHEAWLVDETGRVLIGSDDPATPSTSERRVLPWPEATRALTERESGHVEVGDELILFARLGALGWHVVVAGDSDALLGL